jgi:hypothetical protein
MHTWESYEFNYIENNKSYLVKQGKCIKKTSIQMIQTSSHMLYGPKLT